MPLNARTIDGSNSFLTRGNGSSDESRIGMLRSGSSPILAGPCLLTGLREYRAVIAESQSLFSVFDHAEGSSEHDDVAEDRYCHHVAEKKRRLTTQQVKSLELSFKIESKLEPERKNKLAQDLGLQPRQVAIWFQNRRARYKTKQLEQDFGVLKQQYDAVCAEKRKLEAEVARLKGLLEEGLGEKLQPQPKEEEEEEREERWAARNKEQQPLEEKGGGVGSRSNGEAGVMCNDNNDYDKYTRGGVDQGEEAADMVMRRHNNSNNNNNTGSAIQVCMERRYSSNTQVVQQIAMKMEEGFYVTEELDNQNNNNSNNYYFTLDDQTTVPIFCFDWPPTLHEP